MGRRISRQKQTGRPKNSRRSRRLRRHEKSAPETLAVETPRRLDPAVEQGTTGHPCSVVWRAGGNEGPSGRAGAIQPRFDAGGEDAKPASDGGFDEAVQRVFERGHGTDAHRGGGEGRSE